MRAKVPYQASARRSLERSFCRTLGHCRTASSSTGRRHSQTARQRHHSPKENTPQRSVVLVFVPSLFWQMVLFDNANGATKVFIFSPHLIPEMVGGLVREERRPCPQHRRLGSVDCICELGQCQELLQKTTGLFIEFCLRKHYVPR